MTTRRAAALAAAMALIGPGSGAALADQAQAQAQPLAQPKAIREVLDCRAVAMDLRLACFEKAADGLAAATDAGEVVAIDRGQAGAARRAAFGLPLDGLAFLDRAVKVEEADRLSGVVRTVRRLPGTGFVSLTLEDGSVWRQISGDPDQVVRAGAPVVVERGALGSFALRVNGRPPFKVHRDL